MRPSQGAHQTVPVTREAIMTSISSAQSGTFKIGGDIQINRLGFGAMRITGPGIWGEPADRPEALRTLKRLPELDVNFVDTSDAYGPDVSEGLIREALHPYRGMLIATKGGLTRTGPDVWIPLGRPEYLIQEPTRAAVVLASNRSAFGNFIASIRKCCAMNNSARSRLCSIS